MMQFFREVFRWETVRDSGVYLYQRNKSTGRKRVVRYNPGYQPIDPNWKGR